MSDTEVELSVVSPVYQAEECLGELYRRLTSVLGGLTDAYEIVLVEDCGPDRSWESIRKLAAQDAKVRGLRLSRNFGQHPAIAAGLAASRGQRVVVLDCDLQDPPEVIPQLVAKAKEGFDVVYVRRDKRTDSWFKQSMSRLFFFIMNGLFTVFSEPGLGTFSLLSRQVVSEYLRAADEHSHYLWVLRWLGFRTAVIEVAHAPRFAGASAYSFWKLVSHALDGIVSQSTRLLHISTGIGLLFGIVALVQIVYLIYRKIFWAIGVEGWASLMVVIWLVGGTILFSLGVMGLYLGRMFERTRNRPLFIIHECTDAESAPLL
jgi:dolichol-phosphate mannosyltransferase